jgi:aminopeptidase N
MHLRYFPILILFFSFVLSTAQTTGSKGMNFTEQDSLRGALNPFRTGFDVHFYDLHLKVDVDKQFISGSNTIHFSVVHDFDTMQLDLYQNMNIEKVVFRGKAMDFHRKVNAFFVVFPSGMQKGRKEKIIVHYNGFPQVAAKPPWDGGFVWSSDSLGKPWVGVAVQGDGASLWWPNKDHLSDEPDSVNLVFDVPSSLTCVSNGQLRKVQNLKNGYNRFNWFISYPVNNYNVTLNIADYVNFKDHYISGEDTLLLDYWVLRYNLEKAKQHFKQVKPMMACFERYFGRYPFWNDGFKLVETPYWGMEHQSAIAYGNNYRNNTWGFDFIIIHESAHEWWGNSLSVADLSEMWIHEAFTTYSETLYLECTQNKQVAQAYLESQRKHIRNKQPMLGPKDVNYHHWEGADNYYKGAWMLHSIRNTIADDAVFLGILKDLATERKISTVTTEDVISFFNDRSGKNLTPIFDQYLKQTDAPELEYYFTRMGKNHTFHYRWNTAEEKFNMPLKLRLQNQHLTINPTTVWQSINISDCMPDEVTFRTDLFYFNTRETDKKSLLKGRLLKVKEQINLLPVSKE